MAKLIFDLTNSELLSKDIGLRDQILRASVSVLSNIAEVFDRARQAEFHRFLVIAKGSCAEVRAQLYVELDPQLITDFQFKNTAALAEETSRIVSGLRCSVELQKTGSSTALSTQHSGLSL